MSHSKKPSFGIFSILLAVVFVIQSCGPQVLTPNPGNSWDQIQVETFNPQDISLNLCFGNDADGDGVCDDEEEPECIDDPTCADDADIILDGLNGNYKSGGAWGRWLTGVGIAAGAVGVGFGLVGASGLVKKKGEQKWGWLHQLVSDNPDADGVGFLRLLDKNGKKLDETVLNLDVSDEELFYTKVIEGQEVPWIKHLRQIKLDENVNFAVFINGKNHGSQVFGKNTKAYVAGHDLWSCVAGKKTFTDGAFEPNTTITIEDTPAKFAKARITVQMKKQYTQVHKETMTLDQFKNLCNSNNGGIYIALQLKNSSNYFVNALPTTMLSNAGTETISANSNDPTAYSLGYQVDYLIRQGGEPTTPIALPDPDIDENTIFTYHRYNTQGLAASNLFQLKKLNQTQVTQYNAQTTPMDRARFLLGFSPAAKIDAEANLKADGNPTAPPSSQYQQVQLAPTQECVDAADPYFCEMLLKELKRTTAGNIKINQVEGSSATPSHLTYPRTVTIIIQ